MNAITKELKIAELETIIFKQDERIEKLEESVQGFHTQLTLIQSNLEQGGSRDSQVSHATYL